MPKCTIRNFIDKETLKEELLQIFNECNASYDEPFTSNIRFDVFLQANYTNKSINIFFPELSKIIHNADLNKSYPFANGKPKC